MIIELKNIADLIHNSNFEKLNRKFNAFNPLKVLRVDSFEIRHSNVLSWLLDYKGNHGLGSVFLEKLIAKIYMKSENDQLLSQSNDFLQILSLKYGDWQISREVPTDKRRLIDLLLVSEENKMVILIENKYDSGESINQLNDYEEFILTNPAYLDYTFIPVYLTLREDEPSNTNYWTLFYSDVVEVLEFILKFYTDAISEEVLIFLQNYLDVLQERLVPDEDRLILAEEIYEKHSEAINFLFILNNEGVRSRKHHQPYRDAITLKAKDELQWMRNVYYSSKDTIDFIYHEGANVLNKAFERFAVENNLPENQFDTSKTNPSYLNTSWTNYRELLTKINDKGHYWLGYGLIIFFERKTQDRLKLYLELGNMEYDYRFKLLKALEENGFSIKESSKTVNSRYTRLFTNTVIVNDWSNMDAVYKAIKELTSSESFKDALARLDISLEQTI
ncbi:PDDEXK-like family protein [Paenisporosarcina sp. TG-14]|uniref:PDDEXK-like family protein n=1 Tax=Paenisporosarcina sp. TG-14 TaxID=1231057 RepID=UPI0002E39465|nr:PD-(D/E)XK nuclease family protein [Paenisporosarcina sp. TG-14]